MSVAALPFILVYGLLSLLLCWHDIKTRLLPDRFTCPLLWCGLLFILCFHPQQLPSAVAGAIVGYMSFAMILWLYRLIRKHEGLGYGDVKFLAALGAWHGWESLPMIISVASGLALIFITLWVIFTQAFTVLKNPLPFGPFLAAAGFINGWFTGFSSLP